MPKITRQQLPRFKTLRIGDVIKPRKGGARVVRSICYFPNGDLKSVTFAIKRCSWTKRGYTLRNFTDLIGAGFEPVGVRVRLTSELVEEW